MVAVAFVWAEPAASSFAASFLVAVAFLAAFFGADFFAAFSGVSVSGVVDFFAAFFAAPTFFAGFLAADFFAGVFFAAGFNVVSAPPAASSTCGGPAGREAARRRRVGAEESAGVSEESGVVVSTMRVVPFAGPRAKRGSLVRAREPLLGHLSRQVWLWGRVGFEHVPIGAVLTVLIEGVTDRDPIGAEGALGLPRHLGWDRGAQARHAA